MVVLALVLVWAPVAWFRASDGDRAEIIEVSRMLENPDLSWSREDLYYGYTNMQRLAGPYQGEHVVPDVHRNPERIKVLVLGDSFTYGWGSTDLDSRWPRLLEDELNARTTDGTFEVVTLAAGGASTATQAGWLRRLADGDLEHLGISESVAPSFQTPFDAVVLGYVDNDVIANPYDEFIPEGAYVPTASEDEHRIVSGEIPNPNEVHFRAAVAAIKSFAGSAPALWMPLDYSGGTSSPYDLVEPVFTAAGFSTAEPTHARELSRRFDPVSLMVDPVDTHPGPPLLAAFAKDAAEALFPLLDPTRLDAAMRNAFPIERSAVSNYHPTTLEIEAVSNTKVRVSMPDSASHQYTCTQFTVSGTRSSSCDGETMTFLVKDQRLPAQYVACSYLVRPYAQVMFDRHLGPASSARIELSSAESALDVYSFGYDPDGFRTHTLLGRVRPGESLDVSLGSRSTRGVLFAEEGSVGCPDATAHDIRLGPFTMDVEVRHG